MALESNSTLTVLELLQIWRVSLLCTPVEAPLFIWFSILDSFTHSHTWATQASLNASDRNSAQIHLKKSNVLAHLAESDLKLVSAKPRFKGQTNKQWCPPLSFSMRWAKYHEEAKCVHKHCQLSNPKAKREELSVSCPWLSGVCMCRGRCDIYL